ncbi:hypothetical protein KDL01_07060 [Actinospica durhamensis]|uniref:DUF1453 domain-containing protein n=1 Tax=Actinospica durhamensis TaxID=1508375 RepID=A0A941EI62_9ACTN|nr:hypothetical protein [Actinospica durhamensis]MBR7833015.1 hypothetical protein [Actinospica durhamensis]
MSGIEILIVVGVVGYIIFRQLQGEFLRGKRTVLLPLILTIIGFSDLRSSHGPHLQTVDIVCIAIGCAGSALIGFGFGGMMRLAARDGYLWARLPVRGLWLWLALVVWRVAAMGLALALHAHVAASTSTLLFSLGVNRLAAAAVIVLRAQSMGVQFAPEKNGSSILGGLLSSESGDRRR